MSQRKSRPSLDMVRPAPAPKAPAPAPDVVDDIEDLPGEATPAGETAEVWQRTPLWLRIGGGLLVAVTLVAGSFSLVYSGKVYPGVSADGIYLGGLSKTAAANRLSDKTRAYTGSVITVSHGDTNLRIPAASLGITYDPAKAADLAYTYGRQGGFWRQVGERAQSLFGQPTGFSTYSYNRDALIPYLVDFDGDASTPVRNAALSFNDNQAQVTPAENGTRIDLGRLTGLVEDRLSQTSNEPVVAPDYQLQPSLGTAPLQAVVKSLDNYLSGPLTLNFGGSQRVVDQQTIISWIKVSAVPTRSFMQTKQLEDLFPVAPSANLGLDQSALAAYVANLAKGTDRSPQNAVLAMQDGKLAITGASQTGVKLDQTSAVAAIRGALSATGDGRTVELKLATTQAEVNESNLDQLGIKEQISQGQTLFPGSPSTRLTNVRAGAKRFNGVLLKPDETFSFGKLLGTVDASTGYVPELVILNNHEERQYGGGLCQVSSTAFRAALAAGLPITERHNHSFAISYYTAPYGVPGVDATIYYPQVDFKFKNDTGAYLLMQTHMEGTTLTFDFFGTKTKTGVVRGPEFVTGTTDATKPSHTVFYRDVLDLAGNVTKTDKFDTYYKSSLDFPVATD